jgi:NAD+ kinase
MSEGRRILLVGDDRQNATRAAEAAGFQVVRRDAELVLCHGGDGTLLRAERMFPGLHKLPARLGKGAQLCERHGLAAILERYRDGKLGCEALEMLELSLGNARFHALNDIVLRNDNPALALRFKLVVDGKAAEPEEITGDGIVVATPFGSTGYFHTITRQRIDAGIGIAFNNCTRAPLEPLVVDGRAIIRVEVTRGPGVLVHDNDTRTLHLRQGHRFTVCRAERRTLVYGLDALACQLCHRYDDATFNPH